jgi:hypothetical protein
MEHLCVEAASEFNQRLFNQLIGIRQNLQYTVVLEIC